MQILLSIKPIYSKKIFSGEKKYEFRKKIPQDKIDTVYVYESYPTKKIVGLFTVNKVILGTPEEIWEKFGEEGGITKNAYFKYCGNKKTIYALKIDNVIQFQIPINILELNFSFFPPQNFSYLNIMLKNVLEEKTKRGISNFSISFTNNIKMNY